MGIEVITNNVPRNMLYGNELSAREREDVDYIDPEDIDSHSFFRYKGEVYDPGEFQHAPGDLARDGWQGFHADTYFSGLVIRFTADMEQVIIGRYFWV